MFIIVIAVCGVVALTASLYLRARRRSARARPRFAYTPPPSAVRVLHTSDEMHDVANRAYAREVSVAEAAQRRATHFAALTTARPAAGSLLPASATHPALLSPSTAPGPMLADE